MQFLGVPRLPKPFFFERRRKACMPGRITQPQPKQNRLVPRVERSRLAVYKAEKQYLCNNMQATISLIL